MRINAYQDILLLVALFVFPSLVFIHPIVSKLDEIIFVYMLIMVIKRMVLKKRDILFPIMLFVYTIYSVFLIVYNHIPLIHILQIFITSKFLIIFLYFYTYSEAYKVLFFKTSVTFIMYIFILSLIMSLLQFSLPSYFCGYSPDGRGLWGITAVGLFCSRILYASFLVLFIIIIMSIKTKFNYISKVLYQYRYFFLVLSLGLLFFTFARKELLIGVLLLIYLFKDRLKHESKVVFYFLLLLSFIGFIFIFIMVFSEVNSHTFTENQIRYRMLLYVLDIVQFYFPFGSGPGTYGSIMSLDYTRVYEFFNVPRYIYLGYGDAVSGPIFDLFLVGVMAEYGLGILFFIWFLKKMAFSNSPYQMDMLVNSRKIKIALVFHLSIVALFVPIFLNWTGFLIFSILGILSSKGSKKIKNVVESKSEVSKARAIKMRVEGKSYQEIEQFLGIPSVFVARDYASYRKKETHKEKRSWKNKTLQNYAIIIRAEGWSYQAIEKTLGIHPVVVARGYASYRKENDKERRRWNNNTVKNSAITMRQEGMAYREIAYRLNLDSLLLAKWYASYKKENKPEYKSEINEDRERDTY